MTLSEGRPGVLMLIRAETVSSGDGGFLKEEESVPCKCLSPVNICAL